MFAKSKRIAIVLFATVLASALAGCGSQQSAASASASSNAASTEASSETSAVSASGVTTLTSEQAVDEIANLLVDSSGYKTVTITQTNTVLPSNATATGSSASAESSSSNAAALEPFEVQTVYKFDISGDNTKSNVSTSLDGDKIVYYLDGDNVVADYGGGNIYGGTVKEFSAENYVAPSKVIEAGAGELADLGTAIISATSDTINGDTAYTLAIDPEKFAKVDETFAVSKQYLNVSAVGVTYLFGPDNVLKSITYADTSDIGDTVRQIEFSDYDATTLESAPAATKTYQDLVNDAKTVISDVTNGSLDGAAKAK